jgi:hypothetical protein
VSGPKPICFATTDKPQLNAICCNVKALRGSSSTARRVTQRFFLFALPTLNVTLQLEYLWIVGQALTRHGEFSKSSVIILSLVKLFGVREADFASIRAKARCGLNRRFRKREARGAMVVAQEVKVAMSRAELAVRLEKRRVARDRLIQQINCLEKVRSCAGAKAFH